MTIPADSVSERALALYEGPRLRYANGPLPFPHSTPAQMVIRYEEETCLRSLLSALSDSNLLVKSARSIPYRLPFERETHFMMSG